LKYFGIYLFFLKIPKPLKQYTLFKKDYPFHSPLWPGSPTGWKRRRRLSGLEADIYVFHVYEWNGKTHLSVQFINEDFFRWARPHKGFW